jgi:catechol 2,3-dioxygenase-like lactoylglutathione lyase family enzyme
MTGPANARGFDHLVLCVNDLDAARTTYEALGFTTTPNAVHPFGTGNFLIQLQGCFLELLTVVDPRKITAPAPGQFSFGDYSRRYLGRREGFSMLALRSGDAAADRAAFAAAGLDTYPLFEFEREAKLPDGSAVTVGFTLAFVTDPRMPEAVFFCCQHRHPPEHFWKPAYQNHANGAIAVREVIMVADDPAASAPLFERLQGKSAVRKDEDGLTIRFGAGRIAVLTPSRFRLRFAGMDAETAPGEFRFAGYQIEVESLARTRDLLETRNIPFRERRSDEQPSTLRIGPGTAFGVAIEFVSPSC